MEFSSIVETAVLFSLFDLEVVWGSGFKLAKSSFFWVFSKKKLVLSSSSSNSVTFERKCLTDARRTLISSMRFKCCLQLKSKGEELLFERSLSVLKGGWGSALLDEIALVIELLRVSSMMNFSLRVVSSE